MSGMGARLGVIHRHGERHERARDGDVAASDGSPPALSRVASDVALRVFAASDWMRSATCSTRMGTALLSVAPGTKASTSACSTLPSYRR